MSGLKSGTSWFRVEHSAATPHDPTRVTLTAAFMAIVPNPLFIKAPAPRPGRLQAAAPTDRRTQRQTHPPISCIYHLSANTDENLLLNVSDTVHGAEYSVVVLRQVLSVTQSTLYFCSGVRYTCALQHAAKFEDKRVLQTRDSGVVWRSGRVLDSESRGTGFES
ncbi:hypothetical protein Bbelb_088700 [Branchiostoma belcheri]|nr:hypothetical protein Bbelb_088700 [Branchiostoma belcheri]